jgi:hypothetical protein
MAWNRTLSHYSGCKNSFFANISITHFLLSREMREKFFFFGAFRTQMMMTMIKFFIILVTAKENF